MLNAINHPTERTAPADITIPAHIPAHPKFRAIVCDPPWEFCQRSGNGKWGGAAQHYPLMSLERIKAMPVKDLADDNAHLWLWCTSNTIADALEVIKEWGFRQITTFTWCKPRLGTGNYLRSSTEICLFAVRGKLPAQYRSQINWLIGYPTEHSEKPREFISIVERVSPGPYLELFCRRRPASTEKWYCWGNQCEDGSDLFIPGYPVPSYSWQKPQNAEITNATLVANPGGDPDDE